MRKQKRRRERPAPLLPASTLETVRDGGTYTVTRRGSNVQVVIDRPGTRGEGPGARKCYSIVPLTTGPDDEGEAESLRALHILRLAFESVDLPTIDRFLSGLGLNAATDDDRGDLRAALFRVLFTKGRPWGETRPLEYLAAAVRREARHLRDARAKRDLRPADHPETSYGAAALDAIPDKSPGALAQLIERDRAAELVAALDPRPGEREMLEAVMSDEAEHLTEARKVAGLPDSFRVNLINKAKRRLKPPSR